MASMSLEGEGGLSSSMASTSLEGKEDLSWLKPTYLYWVSTLEERPTLGVLSVSKHLGQSCTVVPTPEERPATAAPYRPRCV